MWLRSATQIFMDGPRPTYAVRCAPRLVVPKRGEGYRSSVTASFVPGTRYSSLRVEPSCGKSFWARRASTTLAREAVWEGPGAAPGVGLRWIVRAAWSMAKSVVQGRRETFEGVRRP